MKEVACEVPCEWHPIVSAKDVFFLFVAVWVPSGLCNYFLTHGGYLALSLSCGSFDVRTHVGAVLYL